MAAFEAKYQRMTPRSRELFELARGYLPGGVAGNAKYYKPYPLYIERAIGSRVWDVDGNEYIDLLVGAGPSVLGHCPEVVLDAVREQIERATNPLFPTRLEIELARTISEHMPYLELIRFANSGSEATATCLRIARAFTGRSMIVKFEGNYHGQHDWALVSSLAGQLEGSDDAPEPTADCAGLPASLLEQVIVLPFNDAAAAVRAIRAQAANIAAVIVEPVGFSTAGGVPATAEFMQALRQVTSEHGILLIFDEVVTAFRLSMGGAPDYLSVTPDLSAIGKALGGGFPIAAFGGRRDILEQVVTPTRRPTDQREKVFHSGTFTGNPVSCAAALATIRELERTNAIGQMNHLGDRMRSGLRRVFQELGIHVQVTGLGAIFQLHFSAEPIVTRRDVLRADVGRQHEFCLGLLTQGVLWPPSHPGLVSAAHTDVDVDRVLEISREVGAELLEQAIA
jgi:glutamate-1-semialdehyde 2,1-aminomutase